MDVILVLAISLAEKILSGEVSLTTDEEKRTAISFLDSQSDKFAIKLVGTTPYGLTDEQRVDFVGSLIFAAMKLERVSVDG
jgi:hypothetical protein